MKGSRVLGEDIDRLPCLLKCVRTSLERTGMGDEAGRTRGDLSGWYTLDKARRKTLERRGEVHKSVHGNGTMVSHPAAFNLCKNKQNDKENSNSEEREE